MGDSILSAEPDNLWLDIHAHMYQEDAEAGVNGLWKSGVTTVLDPPIAMRPGSTSTDVYTDIRRTDAGTGARCVRWAETDRDLEFYRTEIIRSAGDMADLAESRLGACAET